MRYLLMVFDSDVLVDATPDTGTQQAVVDAAATLDASGHLVHLLALQPTSTATTVHRYHTREFTHDGPCANANEQLSACLLIDAGDLDQALAIARDLSHAAGGPVEIRPVATELSAAR